MDHIGSLKPDPRNARRHTSRNVGMIADAMHEVGAARSIVIDEDNVILAGNATIEAAAAAGIERLRIVDADGEEIIAVRRSGLTPEQKRRLALFDNRAAELAEWDGAVIASLTEDTDLSGLFADDELAAILARLEPAAGLTDPDDVPDPPADPVTQPGDLWHLGRHRLLCGDSEQEHELDRLTDGRTPDLLHTDPPYGISIVAVKGLAAAGQVGGSKPFGSINNASRQTPTVEARGRLGVTNGVKTKPSAVKDRALGSVQRGPKSKNQIIQANLYPVIHNDDRPFDPLPWLDAAPVVILWGSNYYADKLPVSSCWICWDKREDITRNSFADCELAWCSKQAPARVFHHLWNGLHKGSQYGERRTHPTEKPVALFEEIGKMFAADGLWLDPYAGTGAQIIAAEQCGTTCYAAEIEPMYCDVIVTRWQNFTGQTAERIDD
jgi:hypothetical protein